ncbi:hypothetical protein ACSFA0_25850 [Variovorax sp. LT1P1]|uniref:hypothetical protein n=1 Tax=Variovorax sp. LT1P1 TaxID=3443730 RepID=UPI003F447080
MRSTSASSELESAMQRAWHQKGSFIPGGRQGAPAVSLPIFCSLVWWQLQGGEVFGAVGRSAIVATSLSC